MTVTISQLTSNQTFGTWLSRTNQLANVISSNAVTADGTAGGSLTSGNVAVNGYFTTNTVAVSVALRGGNTSTSANLTVSSNLNITGTLVNAAAINISGQANIATIFSSTSANVGANVQVNTTSIFLGNSTVNSIINSSSISVGNSSSNIQISIGTSSINATGSVNASSFRSTASFTANSSLVNAAAINVTGRVNTATFFAATSANVGANVTVNTSTIFLGNSVVNTEISAGVISVNGQILITNNYLNSYLTTNYSTNSSIYSTFAQNTTIVAYAASNSSVYSTFAQLSTNNNFTGANNHFSGNVNISNTMYVNGNLTVTGNVNFGGTIAYTGQVDGSFVPGTDLLYTLGNTVNRYLSVYSGYGIFSNNITTNGSITVNSISTSYASIYSVPSQGSPNTNIQTIDSFSTSSYRSAEYLIHMTANTDPSTIVYQTTKVVVMHDGALTYSTEYESLYSNASISLGVFTTDINSGNFRLRVAPYNTNVVIKYIRNSLAV